MKLSHRLSKSTSYISDYLTDMQKFASVHPVITKIEKKEDETYLVHETLKFLSIPFSFTYPVKINAYFPANKVIMQAVVFRLFTIKMTFHLKASGAGTIVDEVIEFNIPRPFTFVMENIFRKQHIQLFRNLETAK